MGLAEAAARARLKSVAPPRISNDLLIIGGALLFGLLSLAVPFGILILAPDSEFRRSPRDTAEPRSTLVRNPRRADLKRERLAFSGNCSIGEFKDRREIEATIRRQLGVYRLVQVEVTVTDMCIAELHGDVRDTRERRDAIRAAGHPWIRAIDIADLRVRQAAPRH